MSPLRPLLALAVASAPLAAASAEDAAHFKAEIRPLLLNYCGDCHGPSKQIALLGMKELAQIHSHRGELRSSIAQLRNRTMPPAKEDQPSEDERRQLADWLERVLRQTAKEMGPYAGAPTARRLNRVEYDNTIRDLLGLTLKFSQTFPSDGGGGEGFDNNGETLYLPVILMERYLEAAEAILDEAVILPAQVRRFKADDLERADGTKGAARLARGEEAAITFPVTQSGPHALVLDVKAAGQTGATLALKVDGIVAQRLKAGNAALPEISLQFFRGPHRLTLVCEDGALEVGGLELRDLPRAVTPVRTAAHRRLFGDVSSASLAGKSPAERREVAGELLTRFANQAFRRPVARAEMDKVVALYDRSTSRGEGFETAMKLAFKAILVSPQFLFRIERDHVEPGPKPVNDHELATRLSYFLWNAPPDAELRALADAGKLQDDATLRAQLKRLLADRKSASFLTQFTEQWLGTKAVGDTVPAAPETVKETYNKDLGADMRKEALLLMEHLLKDDLSIVELLSADYTYLNERLARHYGVPGVKGEAFRKVTLTDGRRGGVLGLGAVQMLTSPGTRTSPVLRGTWILSTLLGTPVPAPPPNIPSLESAGGDKKKGTLSLRQKLEVHRADATCASCHNVIDPVGFSLEHFDRVGRWRDVDEKGRPIDASGATAGGQAFKDLNGFKALLLTRKRDFARQMTSKLLGYALGRSLVDRDDGTIEAIVDKLEASGYRSRVLLEEIVLSVPFRMRNEVGDRPAPKPAKKEKGAK